MADFLDREALRQQWQQHAVAVFDRLFPADATDTVPSFDHLEQRALQLTRDLAVWLVEQRAQQAAPAAAAAPACPHCGQPGQPAPLPNDPRPKRTLVTRAGLLELHRDRFRCTTCRVVFFPPR
jgi:hypothetical protein